MLLCRADCSPLTLFSHDFPPERGPLFNLICLKPSDVINTVPSGLPGRAGWCWTPPSAHVRLHLWSGFKVCLETLMAALFN